MDDGERQSLDPGISTLALRSVAVLVLVAAIVGRALAPALLGWKTGIGSLINLTERTAATLSQLMVVAGGFLAVRLLVPTVRERALGLWYRLGVAPVVPAIVTTVFAAATGTLGPVVTLALALGTSVLALTAAAAALGASETRAAGFVLGLAGLGALIQLVARVLAVRASDAALASLFSAARGLATVGFALDVATLLLALLWLSGRNPVRFSILTGAITLLGVFSAWLAYRGATMVDAAGGGGMDVLVSRATSELVRHPRPFVPTVFTYGVEVAAFGIALVAAFARGRSALGAVAIAFTLAARMATDIPLHALALALGALLAPLAAAHSLREAPAKAATN